MNERERHTHLDLFSGIGGFSLAFEAVGFRTIGFSEIDPYASAVLRKHWPDVPNYGDVSKLCRRAYDCEQRDDYECYCPRCDAEFAECECIGADQLTDERGTPTVITGGFPCQDISNAATAHEGGCSGLAGARSGLWFEFHRVIRELSPPFVLIENVPALRIRGADRVLSDLEGLSYACWPFVVGNWATGGQVKGDRAWLLGIQTAHCSRLEGDVREILEGEAKRRPDTNTTRPDWGRATPRLRGEPDGVPGWVGQLRCYGNTVCPPVAEVFAKAIYTLITDSP